MTTLILGTGLPAPRDVVDAVYARTDGVPLHVEEVLSALGRDRLADSGAVRDAAVPETLEDATLRGSLGCRPRRRPSPAPERSSGGRSCRPSSPGSCLPVDSLDDPIQELVDHDVLDPVATRAVRLPAPAPARRALSVGPGGRAPPLPRSGGRFGGLLEGASAIHASVHFERAGMSEERSGQPSPERSRPSAISSNREAFELMRRAVDNVPPDLAAWERSTVPARVREPRPPGSVGTTSSPTSPRVPATRRSGGRSAWTARERLPPGDGGAASAAKGCPSRIDAMPPDTCWSSFQSTSMERLTEPATDEDTLEGLRAGRDRCAAPGVKASLPAREPVQ